MHANATALAIDVGKWEMLSVSRRTGCGGVVSRENAAWLGSGGEDMGGESLDVN